MDVASLTDSGMEFQMPGDEWWLSVELFLIFILDFALSIEIHNYNYLNDVISMQQELRHALWHWLSRQQLTPHVHRIFMAENEQLVGFT